MRSIALVLAVVAACVRSQETICSDGSICPSSLACDLVHHTCVASEQLTACAGLEDGADCQLSGSTGVCDAGICLEQLCGDGLVTGAEDCDGGTTALCTSLGYYDPVPLTCSPRCTFEVSMCTGSCGDGIVNGPAGEEICDGAPPTSTCIDLGFDRGPLGCNQFCAPQLATCKNIGFTPRTVLSGSAITGMYRASPTRTFYATFNGTVEENGNTVVVRPGGALFAMYGLGPSDIYAVGAEGGIEHFDGTVWTTVNIGASGSEWNAVWGTPGDLYVAGTFDRMFRNTGSGWVAFDASSTSFTDSWLALTGWGTTLMVGGTRGRVRRFVAGVPEDQDTSACWPSGAANDKVFGLWGPSATDVFAVGSSGTICHYDGNTWSKQPSGTPQQLRAVWGRSGDDVFAVGGSGTILHFDGKEWRQLEIDSFTSFYAIGASGTDVRIAGVFGEIYDYEGAAISRNDTPFNSTTRASAPNPGNEYVASVTTLYHWRNAAWTSVLSAQGSIGGLWVSPSGVVVAYQATNLYRSDGTTFDAPVSQTFAPRELAGSSETDLFGINSSEIAHYDGAWSVIATPSLALEDVAWAGGTAVVVGNDDQKLPNALTCSTTACVQAPLPGMQQIHAVYAASATNAFAVGDGGTIAHYDGTSWTSMSSGVVTSLNDIAGTSGTDVIAVGAAGVVLHFDGTSWSRVRIPFPQELRRVAVHDNLVILGSTAAIQYSIVRDGAW